MLRTENQPPAAAGGCSRDAFRSKNVSCRQGASLILVSGKGARRRERNLLRKMLVLRTRPLTISTAVVLRRGLGSSSGSSSSSSTMGKNGSKNGTVEPVYVHPLSQIVLMHFQDQCHDWIGSKRVDALKIHRDGTFLLEFPDESARIWTFYDCTDKKHWLSFRKHQIQHRFLLQDNLMPAWNGNKRQSLPERIQKSVEELCRAVDELDEEM